MDDTEHLLGLRCDMPAERYHRIPAMSASGLRAMCKSPAHFYGQIFDRDRPRAEPSKAMQAGTLMHLALFEPHRLQGLAVKPAGLNGATKAGKEWAAAHAGCDVVTAEDLVTAELQAAAILRLPEIGALMTAPGGFAEASAFWRDADTDEVCKCRPDYTAPAGDDDGVILIDGKTTQDASPDGFARAVWTYRYDLQAAWYSDGFERATGKRVHGFVFAVVESAYPHAAAAYMLPDDWLDAARRTNRRLLSQYANCKRENNWPGYGDGIHLLSRPSWARMED